MIDEITARRIAALDAFFAKCRKRLIGWKEYLGIALKDVTPKSAQGSAPKTQADRPAYNKIPAEEHHRDARVPIPEKYSSPSGKKDNRSDERSQHKKDAQAESVWREITHNPAMLFNAILAIATVALVVTTIILTASTIAVSVATFGLRDATEKLATSTDALVKYAKEQAADMKDYVSTAKDAALAANELAETTKGLVDATRSQFEFIVASAGQKAKLDVANISVLQGEIKNFDGYNEIILEALVHFKNGGPTPTKNTTIYGRMIVASTNNRAFKAATNIVLRDDFSGGGDHYVRVRSDSPITREEKLKVLNGTAAIFVHGFVRFTDTTGAVREKPFRLISSSGIGSEPSDGVSNLYQTNEGNR